MKAHARTLLISSTLAAAVAVGILMGHAGAPMLLGGGTPVMASHIGPLIGPGHAGIVQKNGKFFLSFHIESNAAGGNNNGTLGIRPLTWDDKGWPVVGDAE